MVLATQLTNRWKRK